MDKPRSSIQEGMSQELLIESSCSSEVQGISYGELIGECAECAQKKSMGSKSSSPSLLQWLYQWYRGAREE